MLLKREILTELAAHPPIHPEGKPRRGKSSKEDAKTYPPGYITKTKFPISDTIVNNLGNRPIFPSGKKQTSDGVLCYNVLG